MRFSRELRCVLAAWTIISAIGATIGAVINCIDLRREFT